jgi:hypothetical protein
MASQNLTVDFKVTYIKLFKVKNIITCYMTFMSSQVPLNLYN